MNLNRFTRTPGPGLCATSAIAFASVGMLGLAACGGTVTSGDQSAHDGGGQRSASAASPNDGGDASASKAPKVMWMGDSIAEAEAPALGAALRASGGGFTSLAATASGNVVGKDAGETWKMLPEKLKSVRPQVFAYQITAFDWGTPAEQRTAYERLARAVGDVGGRLVIVSTPPIRHNEFQKPHAAELRTAPDAARAVSRKHPDTVHFVDSSRLWGNDPGAEKAQRSKDGIHNCQQAAATFAQWFGKQLGEQYGFSLAPAEKWATGSWTGDASYSVIGCS